MGRKSSAKAHGQHGAPPPEEPRTKSGSSGLVIAIVAVALVVGGFTFMSNRPDPEQAATQAPDRGPIASDLKPRLLERIARRTIPFEELPLVFQPYIEGKVIGRTVVKISAQP